jgi:hypothetical protein
MDAVMGSLYGRDRGVLRRFRRVLRAAFVGPSGLARYARLSARPLWEHSKYPPKYPQNAKLAIIRIHSMVYDSRGGYNLKS